MPILCCVCALSHAETGTWKTPGPPDHKLPRIEKEREPEPPPPAATTQPEKPLLPGPCDRTHDVHDYEETWYDDAHAYMNTRFCEPAVWFDDFFASDRVLEEAAGSYVRWQNDFTFDEETGLDFETDLNFSVELPRFERRLKLTFEGDDDRDLRQITPGGTEQEQENSLGLRLDFFEARRHNFNISGSLTPRIRFRYRYTYSITQDLLLRYTQEVQREKSVNSARSRLDFELAFLPRFLLRATTQGTVSEDFDGVEWLQTLSLFQRLSKKASVSYESSVTGITQPRFLDTNYRLGIRFRRNIHRDWLFFEITPAMTWPIDLSEDRETVIRNRRSRFSIIFRFEVHFGNTKERSYSDYVQKRTDPSAVQFVGNYLRQNAIYN